MRVKRSGTCLYMSCPLKEAISSFLIPSSSSKMLSCTKAPRFGNKFLKPWQHHAYCKKQGNPNTSLSAWFCNWPSIPLTLCPCNSRSLCPFASPLKSLTTRCSSRSVSSREAVQKPRGFVTQRSSLSPRKSFRSAAHLRIRLLPQDLALTRRAQGRERED